MAKRNAKRKFTSLTLSEALRLFQCENFTLWKIDAPALPPSDVLMEIFKRLEGFDVEMSEPAKELLIDALFGEIIVRHEAIKIWKAAPLATDTLNGYANYIIAPRRAFVRTPMLCAVEAKRDDFEAGAVQCIAEMYACQWLNEKDGFTADIYGIVSNGAGWQFYKTDAPGYLYRSGVSSMVNLPELLGALESVFAACAALVGGK